MENKLRWLSVEDEIKRLEDIYDYRANKMSPMSDIEHLEKFEAKGYNCAIQDQINYYRELIKLKRH